MLGEDIGEALGCGGHLTMLHRIQTGHFELIPSYTIEYLESLTEEQRSFATARICSIDHFLKFRFPKDGKNIFVTV